MGTFPGFTTRLSKPSPIAAQILPAIALLASVVAFTVPAGAGSSCFGRAATIIGTEDDEHIEGTKGDDVITALGGDDSIYGAGGDDRICGNQGNDVVSGGAGSDHMSGGTGIDFFIIVSQEEARVDLGTGSTGGGEGLDSIRRHSIEGVRVSDCHAAHYVILGDDRTNYLYGQEGRETIRGKGGDDVIWGDGEHELSDICPGGSADRLFGGTGKDRFDAGGGNDYIHGGSGNDGANAGGGRDECVSVERSYDCERRT
ncbi:MAG: hypothetical protein H0U16_00870 [Actinobacteria bacterium]|nr:hypothetical protein [Actinomycetota bacterium]